MASTKLVTPIFRVSFPTVFEAKAMEAGQTPKFSVSAIWTPANFTPAEKKLWAAMIALADQVSVEKFKKRVDQLPGNFKKPLRNGDEKELAGYGEGTMFANLSSRMRPGLIDLNGSPILNPDDFYPGCYARATITAYAYENVGKGVAFGLQNLQKVKDGDRLDSRTDAADDFANAEVDDRWLGGEEDPLG